MNHPPDKQSLRSAAISYRKSLSELERREFSRAIIKRLQHYLSEQNPAIESLLAYRALASEVDTTALFESRSFHLFAPVTHHHEHMEFHQVTSQSSWQTGLFGVMEPSPGVIWTGAGQTALICPLTAFDRAGNRLGMGKGCFDYWLAEHRAGVDVIIGLAFSGQEVAQIPAQGHDVPMDCVITEKEVIECQMR